MGIGQHLGAFPKILAVVGSDARPDERRDETRADSIHFVGIDGKGNAGVVGVPRDSWVPIAGGGTSKINASLAFGGPQMMMDTFTDLTDLDFSGYLLTGFAPESARAASSSGTPTPIASPIAQSALATLNRPGIGNDTTDCRAAWRATTLNACPERTDRISLATRCAPSPSRL